MNRTVTKYEATKQIRVTPELHKQLRQLALDENLNLIEITEEVVVTGLRLVKANRKKVVAAS